MTTLAAIDIGSNALRLAVGFIHGAGIDIIHTDRNPIRLGEDVFTEGRLSRETVRRTASAVKEFSNVAASHGARHTAAVATSAVREAANGSALTDRIHRKTGIAVQVIDGLEEARLVHLAVSQKLGPADGDAMLVDIGGGSVEIALARDGLLIDSKSHKLGTVRMLKMFSDPAQGTEAFDRLVRQVSNETRDWVISTLGHNLLGSVIGTGGNVEAIGDLSGRRAGREAVSYANSEDIERTRAALVALGFEGRRKELGLRPDRADVIYPGTIVLQALMSTVWANKLTIPRVGLREGLLADMSARIAPVKSAPALIVAAGAARD